MRRAAERAGPRRSRGWRAAIQTPRRGRGGRRTRRPSARRRCQLHPRSSTDLSMDEERGRAAASVLCRHLGLDAQGACALLARPSCRVVHVRLARVGVHGPRRRRRVLASGAVALVLVEVVDGGASASDATKGLANRGEWRGAAWAWAATKAAAPDCVLSGNEQQRSPQWRRSRRVSSGLGGA